jgi:2'-5' RNA ligase
MSKCFIALLPSKITGIEIPQKSHLTLAYIENADFSSLKEDVKEHLYARKNYNFKTDSEWESIKQNNSNLKNLPPLNITGAARFRTPKNDAVVVLVEFNQTLFHFRKMLVSILNESGIITERAINYIPHITLKYISHEEEIKIQTVCGTVEFDKLIVENIDTKERLTMKL